MSDKAGTILILEDQALIALDIEDLFLNAGFETIQVISSCADAERWLVANKPDVAIIDIKLRDGPCVEVAKTLVEREIPFVVHTGDPDLQKDGIFSKGKWVIKPSQPNELLTVVDELLGTRLAA